MNVLQDLNSKIQKQCRHFVTLESNLLKGYEDLSIQELKANFEPDLWEAICILTTSVSESRGTSKPSDIKDIFLLCTLLFITNDRCSLPFHAVLTDLIDSQGGTHSLIKSLNRLYDS